MDKLQDRFKYLRPWRQASLRSIVVLLVVVLVVLVNVSVLESTLAQWAQYSAALQTIDASQAVNRLIQAGQNVASYRGRTNVLLNMVDPIGEDQLNFVAVRRKLADENLTEGLRLLDVIGEPDVDELRNRYRDLKSLYVEIDKAFGVPMSQRPSGLLGQWFKAANGLIKDISRVVTTITLRQDRFTPAYRNYTRIQIEAFDLRDALGAESARYVLWLIPGQRLNQDDLAETMQLRGKGRAIWSSLQHAVSLSGNARLIKALAPIDQELITKLPILEDTVISEALANHPPPLPFSEYTRLSVPALDTVGAFMATASEEASIKVRADLAQARRSMVMQLALACFCLALGGITLYVIQFRLLVPLRRIELDLEALSQGDVGVNLVPSSRTDEIGSMENAVIAFRSSLIEQRAMLENDLIAFAKSKDRIVIWANPAFEKMLGYERGELVGGSTRQFYASDEAFLAGGSLAYGVLQDGGIFRGQFEYVRKDGQRLLVDACGMYLNRETKECLWGFVDTTEWVRLTTELHEQARTDSLTGLPNRRAFNPDFPYDPRFP